MLEEVQTKKKRIRDKAPHRRSISLTDEDIQRLSYLEKLFSEDFPMEVPFSFSKTISKAVELSYMIVLDPRVQLNHGSSFEGPIKGASQKLGKEGLVQEDIYQRHEISALNRSFKDLKKKKRL